MSATPFTAYCGLHDRCEPIVAVRERHLFEVRRLIRDPHRGRANWDEILTGGYAAEIFARTECGRPVHIVTMEGVEP